MRLLIFSLCLLISFSTSAAVNNGDAAPSMLGKNGKGDDVTVAQFKGKVITQAKKNNEKKSAVFTFLCIFIRKEYQ